MIIGIVVAALAVTGVVVTGGRPLQWVRSTWYDLLDRTEVVTGVVATVLPANATAAGSDPSRLTDGDVASWTTTWKPRGKAAGCAAAPGTPTVTLNFAPRQLRRVNVWAGLPTDDPDRQLQARPRSVIFDLGEGTCVRRDLLETADRQAFELPSGRPVGRLTISVADAYVTKGGKPQLTFTEIQLLARPS